MNFSPQKRGNLESISLVTQLLCFSAIPLLVAIRAFAKNKLHLAFGVEDASCYAALVRKREPDRLLYYQSSQAPSKQCMLTNKIFYIATMFYVPMVLFVKTSLIYIMIRVWSPYQGKVIALYSFLGFIIAYYTVILFVKIFTCSPIHLFWDFNYHDGTCLNRSAIIITDSLVSVITDLAILIFPIVLSWKLHMPISKKLRTIVILGSGGIAVAFSINRLVLVICQRNSPDDIDVFMRVLLSDNAEGGLGLICACMPSISRLLRHYNEIWRRQRREQQCEIELCASLNPRRNCDPEEPRIFPQISPSTLGEEHCTSTMKK
ncbi:uncharacterized protein N7458_007586 [Penicillium daleae]|uniref:Rhodopsin domain-containing protein n=1 Tax=Penicillium daleae TaxID=63821 RepID=A0AAD6C269_9EURO|nr:uncharacterized protein N7458_007586 [Penicillium daleae]KAJ5443714.1 hypothetical protein N7458_007586 [Penicillium daleae]